MLNNKKNIYIQLMFCTQIFSRTRKQNWIIIYQSYVNVVCVYGGRGGGGREVLKCFVRGGQNFLSCFVCVCGGGGRGGQVQYLSFREKNNLPSY